MPGLKLEAPNFNGAHGLSLTYAGSHTNISSDFPFLGSMSWKGLKAFLVLFTMESCAMGGDDEKTPMAERHFLMEFGRW